MTEADRTVNGTLARLVRESAPLLTRFLDGFHEENRATQKPNLPNHPIWTLGHCAFTMARLAQMLGGPEPSPRDFELGDWSAGAGGSVTRFFVEDIAKDSTPSSEAAHYPSLARGRAVIEAATETLALTIERMDPTQLAGTVDWGGTAHPIQSIIGRVAIHNGIHAGQLADLRRALGFARILPVTRRPEPPPTA